MLTPDERTALASLQRNGFPSTRFKGANNRVSIQEQALCLALARLLNAPLAGVVSAFATAADDMLTVTVDDLANA
jgi:hypothetical protein